MGGLVDRIRLIGYGIARLSHAQLCERTPGLAVTNDLMLTTSVDDYRVIHFEVHTLEGS